MGNMWNFNLFKIRPSARESFLSQITGSQNIKGRCEDYQNTPIWNYFEGRGRVSGQLNPGFPKGSLVFSKECHRQNGDFYKNFILWRMDDKLKEMAEPFHFQDFQVRERKDLL